MFYCRKKKKKESARQNQTGHGPPSRDSFQGLNGNYLVKILFHTFQEMIIIREIVLQCQMRRHFPPRRQGHLKDVWRLLIQHFIFGLKLPTCFHGFVTCATQTPNIRFSTWFEKHKWHTSTRVAKKNISPAQECS